MRFLVKDPASPILQNEMTYKTGRQEQNRELREALLREQKGFCAYTESYFRRIDSSEVEHFNSKLKNGDDYFNYYVVIRYANQQKTRWEKKAIFENAPFFDSLFFQDADALFRRIQYIPEDHLYAAVDSDDREAELLIDYLGMNDPGLVEERINHADDILESCRSNDWSDETVLEYFRKHPRKLSFITALENVLGMALSSAIPDTPVILEP